jgi:uncharacterized NAD-dependent epimerase/dehydratase family protein
VIDSHFTGKDSGEVLDNKPNRIPIYASLEDAIRASQKDDMPATHLVIGLAPDGGRIDNTAASNVIKAIQAGLHVDSGLHDFLSEDPDLIELAAKMRVTIRDIRKPPPRDQLHFFSGKIEEVTSLKIAVLGTDSAVGKRTTTWRIVQGFREKGLSSELIGTGQTAWMQGARYSMILDSLVNDFVAGEIEHAVWSAWKEQKPDVIVIEGQGSLMNPAYPGGFEILAAGRPDMVVLQHAPARKEYDGFPGYPLHPLNQQIQMIELLSARPVVAITINHEELLPEQIPAACDAIRKDTGLPAYDVLVQGAEELVDTLIKYQERDIGR